MVHDPVDHGGGVVAEDVTSSAEGQVAGQDQGGVFLSAEDELEEQVRCFCLQWEVADVVHDQ